MSIVHELPFRHPAGGRPAVVALHCSGSSPRQWDGFTRLLPSSVRVCAPQLIGYGGDAWPSGKPVSLDDEARRIAPLLASAPEGLHLVGHSYGGAVALQAALRWPERIRSLTLYEPVRFGLLLADPDEEAIGRSIVRVGREIGLLALSGRIHDSAGVFVDYWSGAGTWASMPQARRDATALRMHKVRAEFEALFADRVPAAAYAQLPMPVQILCGTRSPLPARRVAAVLARACPQAELAILHGLDHMGAITHPGEVASRVPVAPVFAEAA